MSRDGWAVIDDSLGPRWEGFDQEWPWTTGPAERPPLAEEGTCTAQGWNRWECMVSDRPLPLAYLERPVCATETLDMTIQSILIVCSGATNPTRRPAGPRAAATTSTPPTRPMGNPPIVSIQCSYLS